MGRRLAGDSRAAGQEQGRYSRNSKPTIGFGPRNYCTGGPLGLPLAWSTRGLRPLA